MKGTTIIAITALVALWLFSTDLLCEAATFSGRLTTSGYSWQVREIDGSVTRHFRAYQSAILNARRLGGTGLSFHTYIQVSGDLLDEAPGRSNYRIYHAYLKYHSKGSLGIDLLAGRQRVYKGVGSGTIDGVQVKASPRKGIQLSGYAGILVPLIPDDGFGTWDEGHLWGMQALLDAGGTYLGLSFAERARAPLPYVRTGRYSGLLIQNSAKQFRRLGIDVRRPVGKAIELYGRVDLDAEEWEVQDSEIAVSLQATEKLKFSADFQHQKPTLSINSILSVFEVSNNQEIGGQVSYQLSSLIRLSGNVTRVAYDDDSSWRIGSGLYVGNGYIGYNRRIGYGGENDSFTATVTKAISPKVSIRISGNVSGYRVYEAQRDRDQALAGSAGLTFRPRKAFTFDIEGQGVRNKYYGKDFRVFMRGSVWFFKR